MWPSKKKEKNNDKQIISGYAEFGPFDLKPGESKEFEVKVPIPKGVNREEALEILKKGRLIIRGSYVDKNGKMHKFEQQVKGDDIAKTTEEK